MAESPPSPLRQDGTPVRDFLLGLCSDAGGADALRRLAGQRGSRPEGPAPPFLSVLTRTQGRRPVTLHETLLSLAAQDEQDFEVLVLAHDVSPDALGELRDLPSAFGEGFASRVRVVPVTGGGRSRPLNAGVEVARGDYVAILDDDDVVFVNWVRTFKALAAAAPGRVLRALAAEQDVAPVRWGGDAPGSRSGYDIAGRPRRSEWSKGFDAFEHLVENYSPPCCYALPRSVFVELGVRFDEELPVVEDWDVLVRVALLAGVADAGEITSLWRRWRDGGDSSTQVHTEMEWHLARQAVVAKRDARPLLLPKGSASAIYAMTRKMEGLEAEAGRLRELEAAHAEVVRVFEGLRREIDDIRRSTSWRLSAPVRAVGGLARRIGGGPRGVGGSPRG